MDQQQQRQQQKLPIKAQINRYTIAHNLRAQKTMNNWKMGKKNETPTIAEQPKTDTKKKLSSLLEMNNTYTSTQTPNNGMGSAKNRWWNGQNTELSKSITTFQSVCWVISFKIHKCLFFDSFTSNNETEFNNNSITIFHLYCLKKTTHETKQTTNCRIFILAHRSFTNLCWAVCAVRVENLKVNKNYLSTRTHWHTQTYATRCDVIF